MKVLTSFILSTSSFFYQGLWAVQVSAINCPSVNQVISLNQLKIIRKEVMFDKFFKNWGTFVWYCRNFPHSSWPVLTDCIHGWKNKKHQPPSLIQLMKCCIHKSADVSNFTMLVYFLPVFILIFKFPLQETDLYFVTETLSLAFACNLGLVLKS